MSQRSARMVAALCKKSDAPAFETVKETFDGSIVAANARQIKQFLESTTNQ
jgi:hypothetical protein